MLEHLPRWLGHALARVRAGADRVAVAVAPPRRMRGDRAWQRRLRRRRANPRSLHRRWRGRLAAAPLGRASRGYRGAGACWSRMPIRRRPTRSSMPWCGISTLPPTSLTKARSGRSATARPAARDPKPGATAICSAAGCRSTRRRAMASIIMCSNCSLCRRSPNSSPRRAGPRCSTSSTGACSGVGILTGTYSRDDPAAVGPVGEAIIA